MTTEPKPAKVRLEAHSADERLALLRIERPPMNVLDQTMWDLFADVSAELHASTTYRAVVITGGVRHFAAGADVKELFALTPERFHERNRVLQQAFHAVATAPQVTIAAITGCALGGGCELALAADFRIAGNGAVLGLPEITLGIMPGSGGTQRLARAVGHARAKDLILSGRHVPLTRHSGSGSSTGWSTTPRCSTSPSGKVSPTRGGRWHSPTPSRRSTAAPHCRSRPGWHWKPT